MTARTALRLLIAALWASGAAMAQDPALVLDAGGIGFPDGSVQSSALPHRAAVEKTGQTSCFATDGTPRDCAGTGEDGEFQAGVGWPSPRFIDHGDGTVTDLLTGLMWLKDADCEAIFGAWSSWQELLDWVEDFNGGSTGCVDYVAGTYDDWRLPNLPELVSVVDYGEVDPALPAGHPFVNVPWDQGGSETRFASSTVVPFLPTSDDFHVVDSRDGETLTAGQDLEFPGDQAVWPVRGATAGPARVEHSGLRRNQCYAPGGALTPCVGTGQDAELQAGISWPTPRFTDHGDGTVTDELTGLMWLKDGNCLAIGTWQAGLDSVAALNTTALACTEYTPQTYTNWRMANIKELHSLLDAVPGQVVWPFIPTSSLWSSTSCVGSPNEGWYLQGFRIRRFDKTLSIGRAWPVRGGVD